ncbi:MAG TPA: CDF family Co(II)/Ni(II) efflux transporter DmeF [bacterium]|nr:CDF family Co(II)/Ni(II) efflux transporter DmeF [bacterium]
MHNENIELWKHKHIFTEPKKSAEKKTLIVIIITLITMFFEIFAGWFYNSMALFADGWHMSTHATALFISYIAYVLTRRLSSDERFTFGTWKIEILGAYTSAIILGIVGLFMFYISIERILKPMNIYYNQALLVAVIGLLVNIICAVILTRKHNHTNKDEHANEHTHSHHSDLNLRSVYFHVIADALTSVLAIIALLIAKYYNLNIFDPLMGLVGGILILRWAYYLLRDTSNILLDREMDTSIVKEIKDAIENDGDSRISDIHVWRVGEKKYACLLSIVSMHDYTIEDYRFRLKKFGELVHLNIEKHKCKLHDKDTKLLDCI